MKLPLQQLQDLTYPVLESDVVVEPFELSEWWPRAYAMKVCCSQTAALWGTWDRNSDVIYLYSEHYLRHTEPSIHANAIKARGEWMWGAIDPTSSGMSQKDGTQLLTSMGGSASSLWPPTMRSKPALRRSLSASPADGSRSSGP